MLSLRLVIPALLLMTASACKHKTPDPILPATTTTTTTTTTGTPTGTFVVNAKDSICYAEDVQPFLSANCANEGCHDAETKREGINLTSYTTVKKTISGALLLQVIEAEGELRMPPSPRPRLTSAQISTLKAWVAQGMKEGIDCLGPCDTVNVSFSNVVFPIIQNSCISCHTSQPPLLSNYAQIKAQMDNGKIPCTINWQAGCSKMPKNAPQLSLCKRRQIMKWLSLGSPNN